MSKRTKTNKFFYKQEKLTKDAKKAKSYVIRICSLLTKLSGRKFYVDMSKWKNAYEGHMIDTGHYKSVEMNDDVDNYVISDDKNDPEIGMIFFGGHYSAKKHKNALSKAWISLLEDCIGNSENGKIAEFHNLTDHLKDFGPHIDMNCKTIEKLENILIENGV